MALWLSGQGCGVVNKPYNTIQIDDLSSGVFIALLKPTGKAKNTHASAPGGVHYGKTAIEGAACMGRLDILHLLLHIHPKNEEFVSQCWSAAEEAEYENQF